MAKSKRSSSQLSRQQRRLARVRSLQMDGAAEALASGRGLQVSVPPGYAAVAARIWSEVTEGAGVTLVDGKEVPTEP
ncbi:hypothetical protein J2788_006249 [Variovorax paradoxus]|nr:hypothetical protein [Variovorax paradoxus]